MSTLEDVLAAEKRMEDARSALRRYIDGNTTDVRLHIQLANKVRESAEAYYKSIIELDRPLPPRTGERV